MILSNLISSRSFSFDMLVNSYNRVVHGDVFVGYPWRGSGDTSPDQTEEKSASEGIEGTHPRRDRLLLNPAND